MRAFTRRLFGIVAAGLLTLPGLGHAANAETLVLNIAGPSANGTVRIELLEDLAPKHVERIKELAQSGAYDNVAFHRVMDGFMAQTGDVEFGTGDLYAQGKAGLGGSAMEDLPQEFNDTPFERGTVGMARAQDPDSANSQFFIMFERAEYLDGQYTVFGRVTEGMEVVDAITRGAGRTGSVTEPDYITSATIE